jgi:hypothetical protein
MESTKMKKNKDYIYEYSDLNLFQTRVKILSGEYQGVILEFGSSYIASSSNSNNQVFNFDYTLYEKPANLENIMLKGDRAFETFLSTLLINIINDRKKDKKEQQKLWEAAGVAGVQSSRIKINEKYYASHIFQPKKPIIATGLQNF